MKERRRNSGFPQDTTEAQRKVGAEETSDGLYHCREAQSLAPLPCVQRTQGNRSERTVGQ
ncbi:hypothetical protein FNW02_28080 [Komarekiella sp. 'clone 1']|uniref:Uncharacterized protein n=1 Tax=Komarekiella delphini-convector SJRDD-AB1 TaxID=2593771 RepID=A0AA40VTY3_9NOST|nr:hypothetical protein [Komarekiella delphini-convector SJRDD-AB1]